MLILSAFVKLPSVDGCHNGQVVMGGTVSQFANGLAQLTHCKFLGEAHYQISHSTYDAGLQPTYGTGSRLTSSGVVRSVYKGYEYNFLYQSTPLSERLAILISYSALQDASQPDITYELRDTSSNSFTGTVLDHGVKLIDLSANNEQTSAIDEFIFSGAQLIDAPTNTSPVTVARPLYVPSANRGQLLNIKVTVNNVAMTGLHIYDVYEVEVTP